LTGAWWLSNKCYCLLTTSKKSVIYLYKSRLSSPQISWKFAKSYDFRTKINLINIYKEHCNVTYELYFMTQIRVITKLPNTEQSSKGKVKTHKSINRQNQSTTENWENRNGPDLVQAFLKKSCHKQSCHIQHWYILQGRV